MSLPDDIDQRLSRVEILLRKSGRGKPSSFEDINPADYDVACVAPVTEFDTIREIAEYYESNSGFLRRPLAYHDVINVVFVKTSGVRIPVLGIILDPEKRATKSYKAFVDKDKPFVERFGKLHRLLCRVSESVVFRC